MAEAPVPLPEMVTVPLLVGGRQTTGSLFVTTEQNDALLAIVAALNDFKPRLRERFMRFEGTFGVMACMVQDEKTGAYSFRLAIETPVNRLEWKKARLDDIRSTRPDLLNTAAPIPAAACRSGQEPSLETPPTLDPGRSWLLKLRAVAPALIARLARRQ